MVQGNLPLGEKFTASGPKFPGNFIYRHAGRIAIHPDFAIVELVANAWDAAASTVKITWPKDEDQLLSIEDNGLGMTTEEFLFRWENYYYERDNYQSREVIVSEETKRKRTVFGRNGIGRHGMFCFCEEYIIETSSRKSPYLTKALVQLSTAEITTKPFEVKIVDRKPTEWYGTKISCSATSNYDSYNQKDIAELIGTKFIADPEFEIYVNKNLVKFENLDSISEVVDEKQLGEGKTLTIRRVDTQRTGRTTKQTGVAWWVNRRLVGKPGWSGRGKSLVDGRKSFAKKFSYIVEANFLEKLVQEDWSSFKRSDEIDDAEEMAYKVIEDDIIKLTKDNRSEATKAAIDANKSNVAILPRMSKEHIVKFADRITQKCHSLKQGDLNSIIEVLVNLEKARTGYSLLEKLSKCSIEDLDDLDKILEEWSIDGAKKVLDELYLRLVLIREMTRLVNVKSTDELKELQPLFMQGLWIFGPQFESKEYTSNRSLLTVIKKLLDKSFDQTELIESRRRPDFVIIPKGMKGDPSAIGISSRPSYDQGTKEVSGIDSIIIVELKKGGYEITRKEKRQAQDYAKELIESGRVPDDTDITCYVLGSSIKSTERGILAEDKIKVLPRTYDDVLASAHARTFHLYNNLKVLDEMDEKEDLSEEMRRTHEILKDTDTLEDKSPLFPGHVFR